LSHLLDLSFLLPANALKTLIHLRKCFFSLYDHQPAHHFEVVECVHAHQFVAGLLVLHQCRLNAALHFWEAVRGPFFIELAALCWELAAGALPLEHKFELLLVFPTSLYYYMYVY
jgi:hypothetical protein